MGAFLTRQWQTCTACDACTCIYVGPPRKGKAAYRYDDRYNNDKRYGSTGDASKPAPGFRAPPTKPSLDRGVSNCMVILADDDGVSDDNEMSSAAAAAAAPAAAAAAGAAAAPAASASAWSFAVGAAVEVFWTGEGRWFPGTVVARSSAADTYEVCYDDGDKEDAVAASLMRMLGGGGGGGTKAAAAARGAAPVDPLDEARAAGEAAAEAAMAGKAWSWENGGVSAAAVPPPSEEDRAFDADPFMAGNSDTDSDEDPLTKKETHWMPPTMQSKMKKEKAAAAAAGGGTAAAAEAEVAQT